MAMMRETREYYKDLIKILGDVLEETPYKDPHQEGKFLQQYKAGYSDNFLSKQFGISPSTVGKVRKEIYGHVISVRSDSVSFGELVQRVLILEDQIAELTKNFTK